MERVTELLAQLRHVHVHRVLGRRLLPHLVDQPLRPDGLVRVQEQRREDRLAAPAAEGEPLPVPQRLHRAEQAVRDVGRGADSLERTTHSGSLQPGFRGRMRGSACLQSTKGARS